MKKLVSALESLFDFFSSIKLAVIVILGITILSVTGTLVETYYDRYLAQKWVYDGFWMYFLMALLCVNLTAVMVDRWPWKKRHTSFILAHIGIMVLIFGSLLTRIGGLDGVLVFEIGGSERYAEISERELALYGSLDGENYTALHRERTDFVSKPPETYRYVITTPEGSYRVKKYVHFALPKEEYEPTGSGVAVRFLLSGMNVQETGWLYLDPSKKKDEVDLGPARLVLSGENYKPTSKFEIIFKKNKNQKVGYEIYSKSKPETLKTGVLTKGDLITTGWMDFKLRVLEVYPQAREVIKYTEHGGENKFTRSALLVETPLNKDLWVGLGQPLKLFQKDYVNILSFAKEKKDLGFALKLLSFKVGRYQGINQAKSYESQVQLPEGDIKTIAMNEPLHYKGVSFYQSSFIEDESGKPTHSVLTVNKDPGRFFKYLGSFLICLGVLFLFLRSKKKKRKKVNHV